MLHNLMQSQAINHYITYSVITSKPELTYTSAVSTIRCYAVTSGESEGSTFVEWSGNFSSDADAGRLHRFDCLMGLEGLILSQVSFKMQSSSAAMLSPTLPKRQ
jgi:hypothetical protein